MKVFYFDTETTGLDPELNDIIHLAYMIEIDGEIRAKDDLRVRPHSFENIDAKALEINGTTIEEIKDYPAASEVYRGVISVLGEFIDKYDRNDKFTPAGYNVKFDIEFFSKWFAKCGDKYYGSWFNWHPVDPMPLLHWLKYQGKVDLPDYKLGTACEYFGIELDAHTAMSDIEATRELIKRLSLEVSWANPV